MTQARRTWCGHVYDPEHGDPGRGVPPGTGFDSLPPDGCCPDCRAPQQDFVVTDT